MIGRLIEGFDKSAYKNNTIICLWSDHGWHLGEKQHWRKFALWEEATRAPYMWIVPGVTKPGGVCNRTVDYMQVYPTLCDLAGLPRPKHVEGESIRKLLEKPDAAWDKPAITTWLYNNHAIRNEDWRYIRYANGDEELYHNSVDPAGMDQPCRQTRVREGEGRVGQVAPESEQGSVRQKSEGPRQESQEGTEKSRLLVNAEPPRSFAFHSTRLILRRMARGIVISDSPCAE